MEFFGIGAWELLLIFLIALTIFGPRQLILIARKAGEYTRKFQLLWIENMKVLEDEVQAIENEVVAVKEEFAAVGRDLQNETNQIGTQMQDNASQINQAITENTQPPVAGEAATPPPTEEPVAPATPASPAEPAPAPVDGNPEVKAESPVSYPAWTEAPKSS